MFDENTIIILIVLLLLFYFFCKKDVVEGVDPEEKPPVKEDEGTNKEVSEEGEMKEEGEVSEEGEMKQEGEESEEGEVSEEPQDSKEGGEIEAYGRKKEEEVVNPQETSQELRNFVSTNFQGLVKNDFKFCETKGHKDGEQCSNDVDIRSGLRNWAKGKNISTDTTPPQTMIVQIQSFLDQQKKAEEMEKVEENPPPQQEVAPPPPPQQEEKYIPPEEMITEPPVPPTYLSGDERRIAKLKSIQNKAIRYDELIRNQQNKEMERSREILKKVSMESNKAHAKLTKQPVMARCQLGVGEEYKYNPHSWYRSCEGGESANIENCNKDSKYCEEPSQNQNTDGFKSKCKQIYGKPQPVFRNSCSYKDIGGQVREYCKSGDNYVRIDTLQDENDPKNYVARSLGMDRSKLQRLDKGSCSNLVKGSLESDNPNCVGNGGNSWACKFPETSKNVMMLQWTGAKNMGNKMVYPSNSMDQKQSLNWLNNHKSKIIYMIVNQGGKKLAMMNPSYNLDYEKNMNLIKTEINVSPKWKQGLRLVPVQKTLFDVQMKRIFGKKNSEDEYESAFIKNPSASPGTPKEYGTRSFGKEKDIHNDKEAKQSAHDIWYSHFPTQSSLQNNYIESSCMCKQE